MSDVTDWEARRAELSRMTVRELRQLARAEGVCLGYAASRRASAVDEIVAWERWREREGERRDG